MSTREALLAYLKKHPGATVREMARALGMTSANVRHHLSALLAQGLVVAEREEGTPQRGRPARRFYLTDKAFPPHLEYLTRALLEHLRHRGIPISALCPFFCGSSPDEGPLRKRLEHALAFFRERSYQPRWEAHREGPRILFERCPYGLLTRDFPELCQLDREALAYLLDVPVRPVQVGPGRPACVFALAAEPKQEPPAG